ncbi:MAG: recombinase family protein [Ignavibacteriaceae bacterium]|nr:recombinase family protein [Ignavibacteriaceae bacterium]
MKKTIIYTRVSTELQSQNGISLENQEERCKSYCLIHQLENIEIISDRGISGKNTKRAGIQKILKMIESKQIDNVVVYSLSRFARSVKDTLSLLDVFGKAGLNFHSITESIDTASASGRFFVTTLSAISQYERELTSERTKSVLAYKKQQGFRVGSVLFGYKLAADGKKLLKHSEEQKTIQMIVDLKRKENKSYNEIVKMLTERKRKNKNGQAKWYKSSVIKLYKIYSVTFS